MLRGATISWLLLAPGPRAHTPVRSAGSLSARRRSASQQELRAPSPLYGSLGELVRVRPGGRIRRPWEWVLRPAWWMNSTATAERQIRMRQPRASSQTRYCDALEVDCSPLRLRDGARHSGKRRRGRAERACGTASNHVHFASPSSKLVHQTASSTTGLAESFLPSLPLFFLFCFFLPPPGPRDRRLQGHGRRAPPHRHQARTCGCARTTRTEAVSWQRVHHVDRAPRANCCRRAHANVAAACRQSKRASCVSLDQQACFVLGVRMHDETEAKLLSLAAE